MNAVLHLLHGTESPTTVGATSEADVNSVAYNEGPSAQTFSGLLGQSGNSKLHKDHLR